MTETVVTIDEEASVGQAAQLMKAGQVGAIIVVRNDKVVGIFTERDLLALIVAEHRHAIDGKVKDAITSRITSVPPDAGASSVYDLMRKNNIHYLAVVEHEMLKGMIAMKDLFDFRERALEGEIYDLKKQMRETEELVSASGDERVKILMSANEKLKTLSLKDELTGLYNYRYFKSRLDEEMDRARRHRQDLSLIFCDIDHFKQCNDIHGHQHGDMILKIMAAILGEGSSAMGVIAQLRKSDVVARYGGEEFVILLPQTRKCDALIVAERIRNAVENHPFPGRETQPSGRITISVGVAALFEDAPNAEELIRAADRAMYAAKTSGRNKVCLCEPVAAAASLQPRS